VAAADAVLYVFDESKSISAGLFDAAEGAFSAARSNGLPEAFAIAQSTPGEPAGRFYEIHRRQPGLEDWWVRHVTLAEAVTAGRVASDWAAHVPASGVPTGRCPPTAFSVSSHPPMRMA
jgi:hypothetical protein